MNKQRASGRKDGYACISGLVDICERLQYEQCTALQSIIATQRRGMRLQRGGVRMCGALRERQSAEQCRFIHACL